MSTRGVKESLTAWSAVIRESRNTRQIHYGKPPSRGWWPVTSTGLPPGRYLAWWDGRDWSVLIDKRCTAELAEWLAGEKAECPQYIRWQHRPASWPDRSRT